MKNNASFFYAILLVLGDFLALLVAFILAYIIRVKFDTRPLVEQVAGKTFIYTVLTVLPAWILVHSFIGLYNKEVFDKRFVELGRLIIGSFLGILLLIGYDFVSRDALFPARLVPVYGLVFGFILLVIFRSVMRMGRKQLFKYGVGISNVLIIGGNSASLTIANALADTKHTGQKIIGIVGKRTDKFAYFKNFEQAISSGKHSINSIIQTELYAKQDKNNEILKFAQENHVSYRFVPGNSDLFVGNIDVELFEGLPVVAIHQTALIGWGRIIKRVFDLVFGFILLLLTLPIMIVVGLLVKLTDPKGPVFLRQERVTRFNSIFIVYKFRSVKHQYNGISPEEAFKKMGRPALIKRYRKNGDYLPNDPRMTRLGRIIRKASLDELAQLFNVLSGNLSLVGPRALVPEEITSYEKHHAILSVKSGITGLAQISGRRDISFEERRRLDIYYVQNWSFWLDIMILLKTLRAVFGGIGAK